MKTTKTMQTVKRAIALACVTIAASCALVGSAFADTTVHGVDFQGTGSTLSSGNIDVLGVDGSAGDTIFLTVKFDGGEIAKNLPYTLGESASANDQATWAGVATLDIANLDLGMLDGTYTIEAYADRAGKTLLYQGAIYGIYADLPDGTYKLIGTRTADASEIGGRTFNPAETLYINGQTYRLVGEAASEGGSLHFTYEEYDEATTVDGVIKYTDATGAVIASTKIPGLAYGEEREVEIPSVVTAENGDTKGSVYRTVFFRNSVTAVNPGQTSFSVYCVQMTEADKTQAGHYLATINMVDEETGMVIASDSVNVTGEFIYTAPATIYKTETIGGEPTVVTYDINATQTLRLSAANDNIRDGAYTYTIPYAAQPLDAKEVNVTFNLLDGSKRVNDKDRILGTKKVVADEANTTVEPDTEITVGGVTYYLAGNPGDYAYTLGSGAVPSIDVYYVPEGYEAPGPYEVTVNYVNFLTGATIESHSYTSDSYENARIEIETPAEFSASGVDYVRLDGQENAIQHSYYSGIASYTVYYRDVNDILSSGTVINTIRVVYVDGTTAGGDTTTGTVTEGGVAGGADEGVTALQLNAGRTYNVLDGEGNTSMLTNEEGVDSNTERIEDTETPLASGLDKGATSSAAGSFLTTSAWVLPIVIAAVVAVIALFVFLAIRRRKNNDMYEL